jgi:hypothetical protein
MNELNVELRDNQIIITVPRPWIGSTGLNDRSDANAIGTALSDAVTKILAPKAAQPSAASKPTSDAASA